MSWTCKYRLDSTVIEKRSLLCFGTKRSALVFGYTAQVGPSGAERSKSIHTTSHTPRKKKQKRRRQKKASRKTREDLSTETGYVREPSKPPAPQDEHSTCHQVTSPSPMTLKPRLWGGAEHSPSSLRRQWLRINSTTYASYAPWRPLLAVSVTTSQLLYA